MVFASSCYLNVIIIIFGHLIIKIIIIIIIILRPYSIPAPIYPLIENISTETLECKLGTLWVTSLTGYDAWGRGVGHMSVKSSQSPSIDLHYRPLHDAVLVERKWRPSPTTPWPKDIEYNDIIDDRIWCSTQVWYDHNPRTLQSQAGIEAGLQVKTIWSNINSSYPPPLPDRNTHTWVQKMIHIGGRSILL